jgi:hypothetical protein
MIVNTNNVQVKNKNQELFPVHPRLRCNHLFLECTGKMYGSYRLTANGYKSVVGILLFNFTFLLIQGICFL